jgi:hypothetical protein
VYYEEDIAPIALLIDLCEDEDLVNKNQDDYGYPFTGYRYVSWKGLFGATSGRCYKKHKMNPLKQSTIQVTEKVFGFNNIKDYDYSKIDTSFMLNKKYDIPKVIQDIGKDYDDVEIKDSMGLDLKEIKEEFDDLKDIHTTGMFLWAMEAFTNKESINMTMKVLNEWNMQNNSFLKDFKMINKPILIKLNLLPTILKILNPVTQGIAIQRANSYIYKTKYYTMSTAQKHHPKEFADQQHIWQATLSKEITVFTTHPGWAAFSDIDRNFSPDYWVGNGIFPHSVQYKNVHISIYDLKKRKGFIEKKRALFTHAYFPQNLFDEVILEDNYLFGRCKDTYIALIAKNKLEFNPEDNTDCIQQGELTYWICILGDIEKDKSFKEFMKKIKGINIEFKNKKLTLICKNTYELEYNKDFKVNNATIDTEYKRLESPYGDIERKPKEIRIQFQKLVPVP